MDVRQECRGEMVTERAVTGSATKRFTREHVAGNFEKNRKNEPQEPIRQKRRVRALLRVWESSTVLNLLGASKDAGWVVAMIVICVTTFALSSVFVKGVSFAKSLRQFVQNS